MIIHKDGYMIQMVITYTQIEMNHNQTFKEKDTSLVM